MEDNERIQKLDRLHELLSRMILNGSVAEELLSHRYMIEIKDGFEALSEQLTILKKGKKPSSLEEF